MSRGWEPGQPGGGAGLSEAELDRLADYAAGVLDDPDAEQVRRLIATDPRWGGAHAALTEADRAVRAGLLAAAVPEPSMPADVAARIDAALARETARPRMATVVSLDAARSRRRRLTTRLVAAAAAVVAVVGGVSYGLVQVSPGAGLGTSAQAPALDQERSGSSSLAPAPGPAALPRITVTQRDYSSATLGEAAAASDAKAQAPGLTSDGRGAAPPAFPAVPDAVRQAVPYPLNRLAEPGALAACLQAITQLHPGQPALVEFANFDGQPALIVVLRSANTSTTIAVGANCGNPGADERGAVSS